MRLDSARVRVATPPGTGACTDTCTDARTVAAAPPLVLPMPGVDQADCGHGDCEERLRGELAALRETLAGNPPAPYRAPGDEADRARHRWLTGHQAAFPVAQLLATALHALAATPGEAAGRLITWAVALYDVDSALSLYSGSCPPALHASLVRPPAMAEHPAFSGGWARDHVPVPEALRAAQNRHRAPALEQLSRAVKDNLRVRMAVARRLAPEGESSLLQHTGRCPGRGPTEVEQDLYDAHFHVERRPVCRPAYRAQLVRLLVRCVADIGAYGLGAIPNGAPERFGREALARLVAVAVCEGPPAFATRTPQPPDRPNRDTSSHTATRLRSKDAFLPLAPPGATPPRPEGLGFHARRIR